MRRGSTEELATLERLVDEGDTLELVAKLAGMMKEPRRGPVEEPAAQLEQ